MNYKDIEKVYEQINQKGLIIAVKSNFGTKAKIKMFFSDEFCNKNIEELNLSVRSYNCLKRAGINKVDKLIDAISESKLSSIRNLGQKSILEINQKVYQCGYDNKSEESKKHFIKTLFEINESKQD